MIFEGMITPDMLNRIYAASLGTEEPVRCCPLDEIPLLIHVQCDRCGLLIGPCHCAHALDEHGYCEYCVRDLARRERSKELTKTRLRNRRKYELAKERLHRQRRIPSCVSSASSLRHS